ILVNVLANDSDIDHGAVPTVTAATAPTGQGTASVVSNQVQFDPGTDFDYLAEGETATVVVQYTVEDEHGASSTSTVTITVEGEAGNDAMTGGDGDDTLDGGDGDDNLDGGDGNDSLSGGLGVNVLTGGLGNDEITADASDGAQTINGGDGNDTIRVSYRSAA